MAGNFVANMTGVHVEGNLVQGDNTGTISSIKSSSNQSNDYEKLAGEIQEILQYLSEKYPTNTIIGKMNLATEAVQNIESNAPLKQRILSSMKAGGTAAIGQFLNHPAASFVIAAFEEWNSQNKTTNP